VRTIQDVIESALQNRPTSLFEAACFPADSHFRQKNVFGGVFNAQPLGIVDVFIAGRLAVDRLKK